MSPTAQSEVVSLTEAAAVPQGGAARRRLRTANLSLLLILGMLAATFAGMFASAAPAAAASNTQSEVLSVLGLLDHTVDLGITPTTPGLSGAWVNVFDQATGTQIGRQFITFVNNGVNNQTKATISVTLPNGKTILNVVSVVYQAYEVGAVFDVYINVGTPPPPPPIITIIAPAPPSTSTGPPTTIPSTGKNLPIPTSQPGAVSGTFNASTSNGVTQVNVGLQAQDVQNAIASVPPGQSDVVVQMPPQTGTNHYTYQLSLANDVVQSLVKTGKGVTIVTSAGTVSVSPTQLTSLANKFPGQALEVTLQDPAPNLPSYLTALSTPVTLVLETLPEGSTTPVPVTTVPPSFTLGVTLPFNATAVSGLAALKLGIYRQLSDGTWDYQGGMVNLGQATVTSSVNGLGTLAVLEDTQTYADLAQVRSLRPDVEILIARHVVTGATASAFEPKAKITRADFIAWVDNSLNLAVPSSVKTSGFKDVPRKASIAPYVQAALQAGIISANKAGIFRPNAPLTRAEMGVIVSRALTAARQPLTVSAAFAKANLSSRFKDGSKVPGWALTGLDAAVLNGIVRGATKTRLQPNGTVSRSEAAITLYRMMVYLGYI